MTDVVTEGAEPEVKTRKPKLPEGYVNARILPMGDGKLFTGEVNAISLDNRFPTFKRGDIVALPLDVAQAQEAAGRVEIQ